MDGFDVERELEAASKDLDPETIKDMKKCLQKMTHSGNPSLEAEAIREFKRFCRKSDSYVRLAFLLIMKELHQKHSEIRLSAFQVADELFNRSHAFREMLVIHLQNFLALTTETELKRPLPPPKSAANKLKTETLHAVQRWYDKFGQGYRKLAIGYDYLKNCRRIDFQNIQAQNLAEQQRIDREERRKQKVMTDKLAKVKKEMSESQPEIDSCAKEAESCLSLLLPKPDDFSFLFSLDQDDTKTEQKDSSHHDKPQSAEANSKLSTQEQSKNLSSNESIKENKPSSLTTEQIKSQQDKISDQTSDKPTYSEGDSVEDNEVEDGYEEYDDGEDDVNDEDDTFDMQAHGLRGPGQGVTVEISVNDSLSVQETEDNTDLMRSLKESSKLIVASYLPKVVKWLEVLSKNGAKQEDIKSTIDLKVKLEDIKEKCRDLKFISAEKPVIDEDNSDDSEFEEVPEKEGFEPRIPAHLREEYGLTETSTDNKKPVALKRDSSSSSTSSSAPSKLRKVSSLQWSLKERESEELLQDPASRAAALARIQKERPELRGDSTMSVKTDFASEGTGVPVVNFDRDLEYWENPDQMELPSVVKFDSLHRFWAPKEGQSEKPSTHELAAVRNRVFSFTGKFEPVKWKCRAPLPNGKLCERMDRVKCPFHGKIIGRDEKGRPSIDPSPSTSTVKEEVTDRPAGELPPWQDPELQREIEAATGHDLGSGRSQKVLDKAKGKGKGKGKKSGLTDIKAAKNTTRRRLENKIFNKTSMKKVCSTLDNADYKRVRDKFGNQFNYSLS